MQPRNERVCFIVTSNVVKTQTFTRVEGLANHLLVEVVDDELPSLLLGTAFVCLCFGRAHLDLVDDDPAVGRWLAGKIVASLRLRRLKTAAFCGWTAPSRSMLYTPITPVKMNWSSVAQTLVDRFDQVGAGISVLRTCRGIRLCIPSRRWVAYDLGRASTAFDGSSGSPSLSVAQLQQSPDRILRSPQSRCCYSSSRRSR